MCIRDRSNASKWISTGLQAGAEKGIAAILSGGGSAIGDAIGGFVNSLIGGKSQESITKVDLSINSTTKISLEGETPLVGWGAISALPVPGSTSNVNDMPLYNKNLGVWNCLLYTSVFYFVLLPLFKLRQLRVS